METMRPLHAAWCWLLFLQSCIARQVSYEGYIVDNFCWDKPNHVAIDGSPLGTNPGQHILHCLFCCSCPDNGFVILEKLENPASDGSTYWPKYQLDDEGDSLMLELVTTEHLRGGDRQFIEQITTTGTLVGSELQVESLCFIPSVSNDEGNIICHNSTKPTSVAMTTSSSTTSVATATRSSTAFVATATSSSTASVANNNNASNIETTSVATTTSSSTIPVATQVSYEGYIVDNYCWNKPNHIAIDGSPLGTDPGKHILHCLFCCGCPDNGFVILEKLANPALDGSTYWPKYQLDDEGDSLMLELVTAEHSRGGDRQFIEQITTTGTLIGSELQVESLCFIPSVSNEEGMIICHNNTKTISTTSSPTPSVANNNDSFATRRHGEAGTFILIMMGLMFSSL